MGILSSAAEVAANDTNLDVLVKVMLFNLNAKNINLFSLYSPLFTYPTPNIELKSYYTFKYNLDHHLSSSTNETVTATHSAIPSTHAVATSTHAVATSTHAATTLPHAAMTTTQAPSGRYTSIYIDLFNVSERYTESSLNCMRICTRTLYINKVPL